MIQSSIVVNTAEFEGGMQRLREGVRRGFVDPQYGTLPVQARLLAERCQAFTPPRNVGQGKAAVARDLTRIFKPLTAAGFTDKGIRRIVRTDDRPAWDKVAQNFKGSHNLQNTKAIGFSVGWHKQNRMSRGRGRNSNLGVVTLGAEAKRVRQYIGEKKKMVGWARAGWGAAIWGLGGSLGPNWVARHGARGRLINASTAADPFIHVINDSSWAKYGSVGEGNRILRNAISARSRDMESYFFRMMKLAATKASAAA